jgi:hypothetical protein
MVFGIFFTVHLLTTGGSGELVAGVSMATIGMSLSLLGPCWRDSHWVEKYDNARHQGSTPE